MPHSHISFSYAGQLPLWEGSAQYLPGDSMEWRKKGIFDCLVVSPMVLHDLHVQLFGLFSFQGPRHLPNQPELAAFTFRFAGVPHSHISFSYAGQLPLWEGSAQYLPGDSMEWRKKGIFDCLVVSPMVLHVYTVIYLHFTGLYLIKSFFSSTIPRIRDAFLEHGRHADTWL